MDIKDLSQPLEIADSRPGWVDMSVRGKNGEGVLCEAAINERVVYGAPAVRDATCDAVCEGVLQSVTGRDAVCEGAVHDAVRDATRDVAREEVPSRELRDVPVPVEHLLDIYVNDVLTMKVTCSPSDLVRLVVGRLYTGGIVAGIDEIESVYLCSESLRARVILRARKADFSREHVEQVPSCCTGNRTLNEYFSDQGEPQKVVPIPWKREWVYELARKLEKDTPTHRATNGVHSCFLSVQGKQLYCCEDLGRHNAMDKVIGAALIDGIDLSQALVYSSGRMPADMMEKIIRAGIPMVATKAVPTQLAIDMAKAFDVTLVCQARPDSFVVFNDPQA